MEEASPMKRPMLRMALGLLCAGVLCGLPAARAADTGAAPVRADSKQRQWRLHDFTRIELVPREPGAPDNLQPVQLQAEALRQQLALLQYSGRSGSQALFASDELAELVGPLAQALERAGPADDVLLLSTARREGGLLAPPTAITARLFVQRDGLQLIVHDARFEFYEAYRGAQIQPHFVFGSRAAAGPASIAVSGTPGRRADWVSIALPSAAAAAAAAAPATMPSKPLPTDNAQGSDDIERRLETLKRLREKGLITEDEYQQKRRDILQRL